MFRKEASSKVGDQAQASEMRFIRGFCGELSMYDLCKRFLPLVSNAYDLTPVIAECGILSDNRERQLLSGVPESLSCDESACVQHKQRSRSRQQVDTVKKLACMGPNH